jgi:predicted aldo/keto reductase-like oxidoreductase
MFTPAHQMSGVEFLHWEDTMRYRKFGATDYDISILTAGLFQLDFVAGTLPRERFEEQIDGVRRSILGGVNAINLGFPYYIENPERYAAKVRVLLEEDGVRERVRIFMNIPVTSAMLRSPGDPEAVISRQLSWFGVERVDFALIEEVDRFGWERFLSNDGIARLKALTESGKVGSFGFGFRDDCYFLKEIFESYPWTFAQFKYSFMDQQLHPGKGGIKYVKDANAGLAATEPFKERRLFGNIPADVLAIYKGAAEAHTLDEWMLRWTWSEPCVSTVVTSFADAEEAGRFLKYADRQEGMDIPAELMFTRAHDAYRGKRIFNCTECRCCMPCPHGIDAPGVGALYNDYLMYGDACVPAFLYGVRGFGDVLCTGCGQCDAQCPRQYRLMSAVQAAQESFGSGESVNLGDIGLDRKGIS